MDELTKQVTVLKEESNMGIIPETLVDYYLDTLCRKHGTEVIATIWERA